LLTTKNTARRATKYILHENKMLVKFIWTQIHFRRDGFRCRR
jgi:hypothetical protein